jgi:hypothetical protein
MKPVTAEPVAPPDPGLWHYVKLVLKPIASLQLTVVLFTLAIGLIFFGTVAQMDYGIWTVVDKYFWSWGVLVPFDLFAKIGIVFFDLPKDTHWSGAFPFPGGKLLGLAMLINLLAAHLVRFKISWKRSGILLIHGGLILLFVGEFITREYAVEQRMMIDEGSSTNFTEDTRNFELAFISDAGGNEDRVTVIPQRLLIRAAGRGERITSPDLPVDVEVLRYMKNSDFQAPGEDNPATTGSGRKVVAVEAKEEPGVSSKRDDIPSAYVRLYKKGTDEELGTHLASFWLTAQNFKDTVRVGDTAYTMVLRRARYYKPYSLHLNEFRFDRYLGTNKPKNYSSRVLLTDPEQGVADREVVISMNHPLRYRGETFYQADFDKNTEKTTILQVVENPGWWLPYASCVIVTLGLLVHFGIYLAQFLLRRAAA